jgi:hypothetical protein
VTRLFSKYQIQREFEEKKRKLKFRPWVAMVKTSVGWFLFSVQLPCIHTTGFKSGISLWLEPDLELKPTPKLILYKFWFFILKNKMFSFLCGVQHVVGLRKQIRYTIFE